MHTAAREEARTTAQKLHEIKTDSTLVIARPVANGDSYFINSSSALHRFGQSIRSLGGPCFRKEQRSVTTVNAIVNAPAQSMPWRSSSVESGTRRG